MRMRSLAPLVAAGMVATVTCADVTLPHVFSNHMVLQQQKPIPVWGKADPGEAVTASFAGQTEKTVAGADGRWAVHFKPLVATANQVGQTLTVTGKNALNFQDVLIGEVWICSGQSNMQMGVVGVLNGPKEIAEARYPQIRLFTIPNVAAVTPEEDCEGQWQVCSPETIANFSATGYFFGRHLNQQLNVPVGLINTSWGGTVAEAWTSGPALRAKLPEFTRGLDSLTASTETDKNSLAVYKAKFAERQEQLKVLFAMEEDLLSAGKTAAADLDDSQWKTMSVPGNWESNGLPNGDGIVWFRKTIEIPAAWAGKEIIVRPGPIDEVDYAWFNGVRIGGKGNLRDGITSFWNAAREYRVPGAHVKAGKNVIAIRVLDTTGEGGLWGAPADTMFVELADGSDKARVSLAGDWRYFAEFLLPVVPQYPLDANRPSVLYNSMIHPLIPYAIRGAIWYQGESNADRSVQYQTLLPTLIADWRAQWKQGDFPFLIVNLANFMERSKEPVQSGWAELREAQAMTAEALPKVGLAVTIDIGEATDIHPRNKQDVGLRLALAARSIAYGEDIAFSGPVHKSMTIKDGKAELIFDHANDGLAAKGEVLTGFAIAGADGKFVWAQAKIEGNKVLVWADGIEQPAAVRYGWANNPACNLYNGAGLPAIPFRTDRPTKQGY